MRILDKFRGPRPAVDPLGDGVWHRAHDRFERGVRRYHSSITDIPSRPVRGELSEIGEELDVAMQAVREACLAAQAAAPSDGPEIPMGPGDIYFEVHKRLARAATLCARATESAMMARLAVRQRDQDAVRDHIDSARRTVKQIRELIDAALL